MKPTLEDVMRNTPQLNQRQDSTNDQLQDLRSFAIRLGMYDAADLIKTILNNSKE